MNPIPRLALAAVAAVAIAGGALYLLSPGNQGIGGPSPEALPSVPPPSSTPPSPAPQGAVPTDWTTYASSRFAYSIDYPTDWVVTPATQDWPASGIPYPDGPAVDKFYTAPASTTWVFVSSVPVSAGDPAAGRLAEMDRINAGACKTSNRHTLTVDGSTARQEDTFCFGSDHLIETYMSNEDSFYQVIFFSATPVGETDRATYDRFLASFRFGAASGETESFTSARYGFTVEYPGELDAKPSQGDWTYPNLFEPHDPNFDGFSGTSTTPGVGQAWVGIASMPLPDGMSADDWMTWYQERNQALYGAFCPQVPGGEWKPTSVDGAAGRRSEADCGYQVTVTEVVFSDAGRGWIISGDTPLVAAMLPSFQLPN